MKDHPLLTIHTEEGLVGDALTYRDVGDTHYNDKSNDSLRVVHIQRIVRGHLGRKRFKKLKIVTRRLLNQAKIATKEGALQHYYLQLAAAVKIQRWFRKLSWRRKRKWKILNSKAIQQRIAMKKLYAAIRKNNYRRLEDRFSARQSVDKNSTPSSKLVGKKSSKLSSKRANKSTKKDQKKQSKENSSKSDNEADQTKLAMSSYGLELRQRWGMLSGNTLTSLFPKLTSFIAKHGDIFLFDVATVIDRLGRGFVGKRLFHRLKRAKEDAKLKQISSCIIIQRLIRGFLVRRRYPQLGCRMKSHCLKLRHWKNKPSLPKYLQRRNAISFAHLRIFGEEHLRDMDKAAIHIQKTWRRYTTLIRFTVLRNYRPHMAASRIQTCYRTWIFRRIRLYNIQIIQREIRKILNRRYKQHTAALVIQSQWRTHCSIKYFKVLRDKRRIGRMKLQYWARRCLARKRRYTLLSKYRMQSEWAKAGKHLYKATELFAHIDYMWSGIKRTKQVNAIQCELQMLYTANSPQGGLDFSRLSKLISAAPDLVPPAPGKKLTNKKDSSSSSSSSSSSPSVKPGSAPLSSSRPTTAKTRSSSPTLQGNSGPSITKETDSGDIEVVTEGEENIDQSRPQSGDVDAEKVTDKGTEADLDAGKNKDRDSRGKLVFDIKLVERIFFKVKSPKETKLDYVKFTELIFQLAALKILEFTPEQLTAALHSIAANTSALGTAADALTGATTGVGSTAKTPASKSSFDELTDAAHEINDFAFGRLRGRSALIVKFLFTYFRPLPSFIEIERRLESNGKAAFQSAKSLIQNNTLKIQRFMHNRLYVRRLTRYLNSYKEIKLTKRRHAAAIRIQRMVTYFLSRARIRRIAQSLYSKFVDGESGREYWFNSRTGQAFWTKPQLLGYLDCGLPAQMPAPADSCSVDCYLCLQKSSTCYCDECDNSMCTKCFLSSHKTDKKKAHHRFELESCIQCDFQAGTKLCTTCKDIFCDTCYKFIHRKGRLRLHLFEWVTDPCSECSDRWAKWQVFDERSGVLTFFCSYCYPSDYLNEGIHPEEKICYPHQTSRYKYHGRNVKQYRKIKRETIEKAEMEELYRLRLIELHEKKRNNSALNIQRCWRGHRKRMELADFLCERKAFYALRQSEMSVRNKASYRILNYWGAAPILASDTTKERILKMYPVFLHRIVTECIQNNWKMACAVLLEEESHLPRTAAGLPTRPGYLTKQKMKLELTQQKKKLLKLEAELELRTTMFSNVKAIFRNARAAGGKIPKETEAEYLRNITEAEATLNAVREEKERQEEILQEEEDRIAHFVGSRGIKSLIADRRRNGVELPFKVAMFRGARLALTSTTDNLEAPQADKGERVGTAESKADSETVDQLLPAQGLWRNHLKPFDFIKINGMTFQVLPEHLYGVDVDTNSSLVGDDNNEDGTINSAFDDEMDSLLRSSTAGNQAGNEGNADEDGGAPGETQELDEDQILGYRYLERTDDHIVLDRPWVFDDQENVKIFKAVTSAFYEKPTKTVGRSIQQTIIFQKAVAIVAIHLYKVAALLRLVARLFDEDSDTAASMKARATQIEKSRDNVLKLSLMMVVMSYDFTLRRSTWKKMKKLFRSLKRQAADLKKALKGKEKVVELLDSPYQRWSKSANKFDVVVILDINGVNADPVKLGDISIDLEAPCDVLREYMQRNFRVQLNETVGDSFSFYINDPAMGEKTLGRRNEKTTTTSAYAPFKMNNKTMEGAYTCTLVKEKGGKKTFIPEFADAAQDNHNQELAKLALGEAAAEEDN